MKPHKYADLLRYAADNADALFKSKTFEQEYVEGNFMPVSIESVLANQSYNDWQIYKEPVTEAVWYFKLSDSTAINPYKGEPTLGQNWFMKITYVDGVPTKSEFAE